MPTALLPPTVRVFGASSSISEQGDAGSFPLGEINTTLAKTKSLPNGHVKGAICARNNANKPTGSLDDSVSLWLLPLLRFDGSAKGECKASLR